MQKTSGTSGNISNKAGLPPGTLIHVGRKKIDKVNINVIDFSKDEFEQIVCKSPEDCALYKDKESVSWINVDGLHDTQAIETLGKIFDLHPLLLEDILNTGHRPKVEEFDNCIFFTLKVMEISKDNKKVISDQISFVLGDKWVISFQENKSDIYNGLILRLKESKGNIRKLGPDYLFYRLIDTIVDNYFIVTERLSEASIELEAEVLRSPDTKSLQDIQQLKKQLIKFRKFIFPLREAVGSLQREGYELIQENTIRYIRDVYEHVLHVIDTIETLRDSLASIMDLYLSGVSNKMNEVMKVLTIIATIFIPLTFIAGIYGMNFENMPELHWKYGYFGVWGFMLIIFAFMIFYFKRKKWL